MTTEIIWVEWGRRTPKYLIRNLELHSELWPDCHQFLITDNNSLEIGEIKNLEIVNSRNIRISPLTAEFDRISEVRPRKFGQQMFWIGTTRRFFQLYDFMMQVNLRSGLHIESDNVILEMPYFEQRLQMSTFGLGFPMQSDELGCGSIFMVRELKSLEDLLNFILDRWADSNQNDMLLLGEYANSIKGVEVFPSLPSSEFCVDPGAYGKFFLGSDARNFRLPFSKRGVTFDEERSLLNQVGNFHYKILNEKGNSRLIVENKAFLTNIHIHSKIIPTNKAKLMRQLKYGFVSRKSTLWKMGKFDFTVLLERTATKFVRLLHKSADVRLR